MPDFKVLVFYLTASVLIYAALRVITARNPVVAALHLVLAFFNAAGLWMLLILVLSPAYLAIGFLLYFFMREPLPYACPQCAATVGARFNYCPNCKANLHPACPQCKQAVAEIDKFCPNCACDLKTSTEIAAAS